MIVCFGFLDLSKLRGFDVIDMEVDGLLTRGVFIPINYNGINITEKGAYMHFNVSRDNNASKKWAYTIGLNIKDKNVDAENSRYGFKKYQKKIGKMRPVKYINYNEESYQIAKNNLDKLFKQLDDYDNE